MSQLPEGLAAFVENAGWGGAEVAPLAGDASFRRYFRVRRGADAAVLMDAPPPHEDPQPFLRAAKWLDANGLRAPRILAEDAAAGLVLLEDFGEVRMREYVDAWPADETEVYRTAIDALIELHSLPAGPFLDYSLSEYMREVRLFTDWYCPTRGLYVDAAGYAAAWEKVLGELLPRQRPGVCVLRDYHAENIMLLGSLGSQGLLDFQDALNGHKAYDLVSLLQDARRDVSPELEIAMFDYYLAATGKPEAEFAAAYATLGAQRALRILGIFARLCLHGGKPGYLRLIPRVWGQLQQNLRHPALAPLAKLCQDLLPEPSPDRLARIADQCPKP